MQVDITITVNPSELLSRSAAIDELCSYLLEPVGDAYIATARIEACLRLYQAEIQMQLSAARRKFECGSSLA